MRVRRVEPENVAMRVKKLLKSALSFAPLVRVNGADLQANRGDVLGDAVSQHRGGGTFFRHRTIIKRVKPSTPIIIYSYLDSPWAGCRLSYEETPSLASRKVFRRLWYGVSTRFCLGAVNKRRPLVKKLFFFLLFFFSSLISL